MRKFNEIKPSTQKSISTGIVELDQFLSFEGGIPLGYLLFFTASPGAGKTSLSVLIMRNIITHKTALLEREVSAELLAKQVKNIDASKNQNYYIEDQMSIQEFLKYTAENNFKIIVIDSIQSCRADFPGHGDKAADKEIYALLRAWTTTNTATCIIIGQSTKNGVYAGASNLAHDFDANFQLHFDKSNNTRWIESPKNRLGGATGVPLFYRFTNTSEILEFSNEGFEKEVKTLNDYVFEGIKQFVHLYKKTDKRLYNEICKAVDKIAANCDDDEIVLLRAVQTINVIVNRHGQLKKIA